MVLIFNTMVLSNNGIKQNLIQCRPVHADTMSSQFTKETQSFPQGVEAEDGTGPPMRDQSKQEGLFLARGAVQSRMDNFW